MQLNQRQLKLGISSLLNFQSIAVSVDTYYYITMTKLRYVSWLYYAYIFGGCKIVIVFFSYVCPLSTALYTTLCYYYKKHTHNPIPKVQLHNKF